MGQARDWNQGMTRRNPIVGSVLATILAGFLLQASNIIDFQQRVASGLIDQFVPVRLIDIAFRMAMGALLVVAAMWTVGGYGWRQWRSTEYANFLRISMGHSPRYTSWATMLSVLGFVGLLVGSSVAAGVFSFNPEVLVADDNWLILLAALVPGIWEELTFRGAIQSGLLQPLSPRWAVIGSSVLFGLMHFSNVVNWEDDVVTGVIAAVILGVGWGYAVLKTGSVLPAMVGHYVVDVVLFDELFISATAGDDATGPVYATIILGYPLLTIVTTRFGAHRAAPPTG
jgi:membrane protease YdiL (CAAX protease family)